MGMIYYDEEACCDVAITEIVPPYDVDKECLTLATYFHGFIYSDEKAIKEKISSQIKNINENYYAVINVDNSYVSVPFAFLTTIFLAST